jgi:hypothetical protein
MPLALDSCGGCSGTGWDLAAGEPDTYWPGLMGFGTSYGHWFYRFLLLWAALAVVAALPLLLKQDLSARRRVVPLLAAVGGAISFYVAVDFATWAPILTGDRLSPPHQESVAIFVVGLTAYIALRAAWAKAVRASLTLRLIFLILGALTALFAASEGYLFATGMELLVSSPAVIIGWILLLASVALWVLGPLALWLRHSLWPMADSSLLWPSARRLAVLAYTPVVAAQLWVLWTAAHRPYRVWGLVPCLLGIHLITLGYLRLRKQAEAARVPALVADSARIRVPQAEEVRA